jgi:uncharacterized membrane protein
MQQQNSQQPHYSLLRRWLFPYSGIEPLTHAQQRRVIITWALVFPALLFVLTLPLVAVLDTHASFQTVILILALVFFGGVLIFSLMAIFVVWAVNQTARTVQQGNFRTATQPETTMSSQEPDEP